MYVLMGANGNITSRAVRALLQQGKPVRVIGRSAAALAPLDNWAPRPQSATRRRGVSSRGRSKARRAST